VETHLAGEGLNGRDSTHIPTVSLASAGSPLGFESGSRSELLETVNLSTSVRRWTADAVPWELIRDRQLDSRRSELRPRCVRDSVCTAIRDKIHRPGLEENAASQDRQTDTDKGLTAQGGLSTLDPSSGGGPECSGEVEPPGPSPRSGNGPIDERNARCRVREVDYPRYRPSPCHRGTDRQEHDAPSRKRTPSEMRPVSQPPNPRRGLPSRDPEQEAEVWARSGP